MDPFHQPSRGWLSQRLQGREWWILAIFLLFYLGLLISPGQELLESHHFALQPASLAADSLNLKAETFLGLP